MANDMKRAQKRYLREVRSLLIVRTKEARAFMAEFADSVDRYVEENNVHSITSVQEHFGAPEEIAKAFLETAELTYIRKRVRIRNGILAILLAALVLWASVLGILLIDGLDDHRGYGVESGVMDPDPNDGFIIDDEV